MSIKPGANKYKRCLLPLNRSVYRGMFKGTVPYTPITYTPITPFKEDTHRSKQLTVAGTYQTEEMAGDCK